MSAFFMLAPPPLTQRQYCVLQDVPKDVRNMDLPARGDSIKGKLTEVRDYKMSAAAKGIQVADIIANAYTLLMVTEKLKDLLEAHAQGAQIEYLAFRLLNHKMRVAADPCYIVNVLGRIDCADPAKSEGVEDPEYGEYFIARKLTLIDAKVPKDRNIFRTKLFPPGIWVREDLKKVLEKNKVVCRFIASGEDI